MSVYYRPQPRIKQFHTGASNIFGAMREGSSVVQQACGAAERRKLSEATSGMDAEGAAVQAAFKDGRSGRRCSELTTGGAEAFGTREQWEAVTREAAKTRSSQAEV